MTGVGIVVEYNPFHNGHSFHLKKSKEKGDVTIAVMSGDFVQRGEPALLNRWERAETALYEGADIVAELPVFYSVQSAEIFARGAVGILKYLGAEKIVFGSETGNMEKFQKLTALEENKNFTEELQKNLKNGNSYPTAYSSAVKKFLGEDFILESNDILGAEYIRAIKFWGGKITPHTIKREGAGYHSHNFYGNIGSATGIRKLIKENENIETIKKFVPESSCKILLKNISENKITDISKFYNLIRYAVLSQKENLKDIQDMETGFDNRLYEAALTCENYQDFLNKIITKRFTTGRIQRVLIHVLLGITKDITENAKKKIPYIRILGFSQKGREYLKNLKNKSDVKIITSLKNIRKILSEDERKFLELNERAGKIYGIINPYKNKNIPLMFEEEK